MAIIVAILFACMGVIAIAMPAMLGTWVGHDQLSRDGANEFRAVYGGFGLAMAGVLFGTHGTPLASGVQLTVGLALAGMAGGRLIAALLDGPPSGRMWLYAIFEVGVGLPLILG